MIVDTIIQTIKNAIKCYLRKNAGLDLSVPTEKLLECSSNTSLESDTINSPFMTSPSHNKAVIVKVKEFQTEHCCMDALLGR